MLQCRRLKTGTIHDQSSTYSAGGRGYYWLTETNKPARHSPGAKGVGIMKNADMPAMPMSNELLKCSPDCTGLTKREHFAGLAMQALLSATNSDGEWTSCPRNAADLAVSAADHLIFELEKR